LRHSKDDSDTIDLAPSHFPPLPTSPLPLFVSILAVIISSAVGYQGHIMVALSDWKPSHILKVPLIALQTFYYDICELINFLPCTANFYAIKGIGFDFIITFISCQLLHL